MSERTVGGKFGSPRVIVQPSSCLRQCDDLRSTARRDRAVSPVGVAARLDQLHQPGNQAGACPRPVGGEQAGPEAGEHGLAELGLGDVAAIVAACRRNAGDKCSRCTFRPGLLVAPDRTGRIEALQQPHRARPVRRYFRVSPRAWGAINFGGLAAVDC